MSMWRSTRALPSHTVSGGLAWTIELMYGHSLTLTPTLSATPTATITPTHTTPSGANELALTLTLCAPTDASGHVTIDVDSSGRIIHASGLQAAFFTHALTKRPSRLPPPHPTTSRAALMGPSQRELTAMPTAAHQASSSALPAANPMQGSFAEASLTGPGGGVG